MTNEKKKDDHYYAYFKGAKLTKREGNIVGLSVIFGLIGAVGLIAIPVEKNKIIAFAVITLFALVGYVIGSKIFR